MKRPDGPKTPKFIQRLEWILDPLGYMERSNKRYPDLFVTKVIGSDGMTIFVSHPQAIKQLLANDRKQFIALSTPSEANPTLKPLLGDTSVIMLEGAPHKKRRHLVMPPFHGERMRIYGELISNVTRKVMSQLPTGKPFLAREAMQSISLQVILEVVFGLYEGERCQQLRQLMGELVKIFRSPLSSSFFFIPALQKDWGAWSPWGKFVRQRQQIDDLLYAEIAERRANPDPDRVDILSMLMAARDQEDQPMSDRELRDELMGLMFGGYESMATAMAWALYWTHYLPEVREKLLSELNGLSESLTLMDIVRLPYLTAVCQESLRIYPVAMITFPRVVQEPVEMIGYHLEPGTAVMGCMHLTHQREDLYLKREQFRPERFLERQFSPYEFFPFGGGIRRCIGEALAQFEMKLILATILSEYQLTLVDRKPERPQRRGVSISPKSGVKMQILGTRTRQDSDHLQQTIKIL